MNFTEQRIPYRQANNFTKIILDYIDHAGSLRDFYQHIPSVKGIGGAIENRKAFSTNRKILVEHLKDQYKQVTPSQEVNSNIELLLSANTFTITTAHQPNIFTGPLYFIYKILHAVKLAAHCKENFPENNFVPVFYMGSEDADLDELGHCYINSEKLTWSTKQTGAVGRMKVDKELLQLIEKINGQIGIAAHGEEVNILLKESFKEGMLIQDATFHFLHALFSDFGLIVLIADKAGLKEQMQNVFKDDLLNKTASGIVANAGEKLNSNGYKVQANPREINLFYLKDDKRERIEGDGNQYTILNSPFSFTKEQILNELQQHPERFSPNVIVRGLYQETILPNIAFIGGGGELAYWLQLKDLFNHYQVPFPLLVLRNSFLVVENKWKDKIVKTGFNAVDFFQTEEALMNVLVGRESKNELLLNGTLNEATELFDKIKKQAGMVDPTLAQHTEALKTQAVKKLKVLEKKMLRAEKRKFTDTQRQIQEIRKQFFPDNGLQERKDNFIPYYAKWGKSFLTGLYNHSLKLEQEFVILTEK